MRYFDQISDLKYNGDRWTDTKNNIKRDFFCEKDVKFGRKCVNYTKAVGDGVCDIGLTIIKTIADIFALIFLAFGQAIAKHDNQHGKELGKRFANVLVDPLKILLWIPGIFFPVVRHAVNHLHLEPSDKGGAKEGSSPMEKAMASLGLGGKKLEPLEEFFLAIEVGDAKKLAEVGLINPKFVKEKKQIDGIDRFPIYHAIYHGHAELVEPLIGLKADANENVAEALYIAAEKGDIKSVKLLCENGARINSRTGKIVTPLHVAAQFKQEEIAKFLIDQGAEKNVKNLDKKTPFQLAKENGGSKTLRDLLDTSFFMKDSTLEALPTFRAPTTPAVPTTPVL